METAFAVVEYDSDSQLSLTWYFGHANVINHVLHTQASDSDADLLTSADDLRVWLRGAMPGDTTSPGWGVLWVGRLFINGDVATVEDYDDGPDENTAPISRDPGRRSDAVRRRD